MSDIGSRLATALAGRYVVERELGHGGMATVHLARDVKHGRTVAIKVLRPDLAQAVGSERFLREINIAAQLQSPHILPMLESGEADGLIYYVMPFVDGDSLRSRLVRQGALPPSEAMRLLRDVVDAVAHAHRHQVVHRDIKPDNVMIAERHAVVMDFGVAKAMSDATGTTGLTSIGISLGTPAYMAPEQAAADPNIDHRADIYSVGVLAYEMLAGKPPFAGAPQAILTAQIAQAPPSLQQVKPDVPPAIAQIVMKCLEKEPSKRYQTADDLLNAIEALVTPSAAGAPSTDTPQRRVRRRLAGAGALLTVIILAVFGMGRVRKDRWVHQTALPELRRLIEAAENDSAFALATQIQDAAPADSTLNSLWPRFSRLTVVHTDPEGATVYRASLTDTTKWHLVGTTPTDSIRLPNRPGLFRFEKPGYRTAYSLLNVIPPTFLLDSVNAPNAEMVRIPGGQTRAFLVGSDGARPVRLANYFMDRFEVSNSQYKAFVDAGGYGDRQWWDQPFTDVDGKSLSFEAAMARFVDRTGRPGPATWKRERFRQDRATCPSAA